MTREAPPTLTRFRGTGQKTLERSPTHSHAVRASMSGGRHYYEEQVCDREMGEKEKRNGLYTIKRGGTRDSRVVRNSPSVSSHRDVPGCTGTEGHVWVHSLAARGV